MQRLASWFLVLFVALLAGCAHQYGAYPGETQLREGKIEQITPIDIASNHHQGLGAIVGGLGGLGIGSLIGGGSGRDVAMVLGAIGGAVAGNEIQRQNAQPIPGQQIIVRLYSGVLVQVTQPLGPYLQLGQPVFVEGFGESARVIPR